MVKYLYYERRGKMYKSFKKSCLLTFWMMLGVIIGVFIDTLTHQIYELLYKHFPDTVHLYNPVLEKDGYSRFSLVMSFITVSLTILLSVYICQRFNNDRFEFIIAKTDGLYKIRAILKTYISNYWISDVISSVFTALTFTVPIYFIPRGFFTTSTFFVDMLTPLRALVDGVGILTAALYCAAAFAVSHAITLPLILKFYRAKWLTGFAEGTV